MRIWNLEVYKDVIENCGSQFTEKYQNIMLLRIPSADS